MLKSSTATLLPSQLVERANAQLQRILAEQKTGEKSQSKPHHILLTLASSLSFALNLAAAGQQQGVGGEVAGRVKQTEESENSGEKQTV